MVKRKIGKDGRLVIPKEFVEKVGIKSHMLIDITSDKRKIILRKAPNFCVFCESEDVIEGSRVCRECAKSMQKMIG